MAAESNCVHTNIVVFCCSICASGNQSVLLHRLLKEVYSRCSRWIFWLCSGSVTFLSLLQIFDNEAKDLEREVCFIDIASDEIPERYYKESEVRDKVKECSEPQ